MTDDHDQDELLENWTHCCAVRRDTLLERWPSFNSSKSCASSIADACAPRKSHGLTVQFSENSTLHFYEKYPTSPQSLAYTKEDRDEFGKDALLEGLRIKNLIATAPGDSVCESMKYLLRHRFITKAEIVGIDHFITGTSTSVLQTRRNHSAAVLKKQNELRHDQELEEPAWYLAKFAQSRSHKSTERARTRAAFSACSPRRSRIR